MESSLLTLFHAGRTRYVVVFYTLQGLNPTTYTQGASEWDSIRYLIFHSAADSALTFPKIHDDLNLSSAKLLVEYIHIAAVPRWLNGPLTKYTTYQSNCSSKLINGLPLHLLSASTTIIIWRRNNPIRLRPWTDLMRLPGKNPRADLRITW